MKTPYPSTMFKFYTQHSAVEKFLVNRWWWLLVLLIWGYLVGWSFWHTRDSITDYSLQTAREGARNMFNMVRLTRLWNATHDGVYVPVTDKVQPNPHLDVPDRDIETRDNRLLTMINPAFMTRQIAELSQELDANSFHLTSLKPIRPANAADPWEAVALKKFVAEGGGELAERVTTVNSDLFRYMAPLVTKPTCLKCHAKQGYKVGDIRGGISVTFQAEPIFGGDASRVTLAAVQHGVVFLLVAVLLISFLIQMRHQWLAQKHIKEHQQRIIKERTHSLEDSNFRLERNKARLQAVVENAMDGIITIDELGNIEHFNREAEKIFGWRREEVQGGAVTMIIPKDLRDAHKAGLARYLKTNQSPVIGKRVQLRGLHRSGRQPDIELSINEVCAGGERRFTALIRDITEKKAAEAALKQAHDELHREREQLAEHVVERTADLQKANDELKRMAKAKDDFLANMSHELRTPLNHIIGFTELVASRQFGEINDIQDEYLKDALHSSHHLLSLINDILDLSKLEAGKMELDCGPVDLQQLLETSLVMIREKALKQGIQLTSQINGIPKTISADGRKLKQIMYNLLGNAVKFTPDNGNITLGARIREIPSGSLTMADGRVVPLRNSGCKDISQSELGIQISVSDTGIGLEVETLDQVFKPFEQVESSITRKYQGTGLGLSLTKNFVELHGGVIWAESGGPNQGSTFTFVIPCN